MQGLPHIYVAGAEAGIEGATEVMASGLPSLACSAPAEFGGPGDQWSPETLLVAAVADCFVLSFRAIARASKLDWIALQCQVEGVLDKPERAMEFVKFTIDARLVVPADADPDKAKRLLSRAEQTCLITNSLKAESHLNSNIETVAR
jgi:peroxiredoxin-like protein